MRYIDALGLINLCVKNAIINESHEKILVYRRGTSSKEAGWDLSEKSQVAQELMNDKEGQEALISALKKKDINFTPQNQPWSADCKNDINLSEGEK